MASDIVSADDSRPHPYSIARSIYDNHPSDISHPFNSLSSAATVPSRSTPLAVHVTPVNRNKLTRLTKPLRRRLTTRSLGHSDDDHSHRMAYTDSTADVNEHDLCRSFFEGMNKVDGALKHSPRKRTCSMVNISLKSIRSWFASVGDHLTPPPMVGPPQSEQPYHYRKRSLRRTMSSHNGDIGGASPDEQNVEIAQKRAGVLGTAIRTIESASYIPASTFIINSPDGSSGPYPFAYDDIDSVSSRSIYSPISSPFPPVHRVLLFTKHKEDKVEQIPKEAPQECVFEQPLAASIDSDTPPASPLSTLRPGIVSFSRPTPQVYPHLICPATARQESLRQVVHQPPVRVNIPLEATSELCLPPLSPPPLPNRSPKRTPSDNGHGPLIHATLDQSFRGGGQDKLVVFTPGPDANALNSSATPALFVATETLTPIGKRL